MAQQEYARHLGGLIANLHSLEFLLRVFLQRKNGARPTGLPIGTDIYSLAVGSELPENELTNYDSLGALIQRYNREVPRPLQVDPQIVDLRDALAHGRICADMSDTMRLLKFARPSRGRVRILFNEILSTTWFTEKKTATTDALFAVHRALQQTSEDQKP